MPCRVAFPGRRGWFSQTLPVEGQRLLQEAGDDGLRVEAGHLGDGFQHELKTLLLLPEDRHVVVNYAQDIQQLKRKSQSEHSVVVFLYVKGLGLLWSAQWWLMNYTNC